MGKGHVKSIPNVNERNRYLADYLICNYIVFLSFLPCTTLHNRTFDTNQLLAPRGSNDLFLGPHAIFTASFSPSTISG